MGRTNDRFRDLVDIVLLRGLLVCERLPNARPIAGSVAGDDRDLPALRAACVHVFASRQQHPWPPRLEVPPSWVSPYARLSDDLGFDLTDVGAAAERARVVIDEVDAVGGRWAIATGPEEAEPQGDHRRLRYTMQRDEESMEVHIDVAGTAAASVLDTLPSQVADAISTDGKSELMALAERGIAPARIVVTSETVQSVTRSHS